MVIVFAYIIFSLLIFAALLYILLPKNDLFLQYKERPIDKAKIMDIRKFTIENWKSGSINLNTLSPCALEIKDCDKIILHHKSLEFDFELSKDIIDKFDTIVVNGIKFRREYVPNNEQLD